MDDKINPCQNRRSKKRFILFVGDPDRGKRLQEAVRPCGWEIRLETQGRSAPDNGVHSRPDLVILDGFPESIIARSAYYQLYHFSEVRFLALNDSPNAMKFLHVNALSFIKLINRDPKPKELLQAIADLVGPTRKSASRYPGKIDLESRLPRCKPNDLCYLQGYLQGKSCC